MVSERADPQLAIYAQGGVDLEPVLALSPAQPTAVGESCFTCFGDSEPLYHTVLSVILFTLVSLFSFFGEGHYVDVFF